MPILINRETGLAEDVSHDQLEQATKSTHDFPLVSAEGEHYTASADDVHKMIEQGFRQPDAKELKGLTDYAKYSSTGEQLKTAAEGLASGIAGSLAPLAERALGIDPEDIRAREEVNPWFHGLSEAAGLIGSTAAGFGAGAVIEKAGIKAATALGIGATKVSERVGSAAVRAAVEGMVFQAGDETSKLILNDPAQRVDTAAINIGLAGLIGAGVGAGLTGTHELWKMGPGAKLGQMLDDIKDRSTSVPKTEKASPLHHEQVSGEEFHSKIQEVMKNPNPLYKANITPYSPEDYSGFKTFLSADKKSGYAIKPNGELISVFSLEKGRGIGLLDDAVINKGASSLDAFDINNKLPTLYGRYMDETSRLKFADEYAPSDWNYEALGRPDVVMMSLNPKKLENLKPALMDIPPELKAVLAKNPKAQEAFSTLIESNTKAGKELRETVQTFKQGMAKAAGETLGFDEAKLAGLADLSKAEVGTTIKDSLINSIESKIAPIAKAYDDFTEKFSGAALGLEERQQIVQKMVGIIEKNGLTHGPNEEALKLVNKVISNFDQMPKSQLAVKSWKDVKPAEKLAELTAQDLRKYMQQLRDMAPYGSPLYQTGKEVRAALGETLDSVISKRASGEAADVFEKYLTTNKEYGAFKGLLEDLNDRLRMGKSAEYGVKGFINNLKSMAPEDAVQRLGLKGDVNLQSILGQHFPETAAVIKQQEIAALMKKTLKDGVVDVKKLGDAIDKLEPELKQYLFSGEQRETIKSLGDMLHSLPARMNPSGTARTLDALWKNVPSSATGLGAWLLGKNPLAGALLGALGRHLGTELPDAAKLTMLKFLGTDAATNPEAFKKAAKFIEAAIKGEQQLEKATKAVFFGGGLEVQSATAKQRDKLKEKVDEYSAEPEKLLNLESSEYLEDQGAALGETAGRAVMYLASLRPNTEPQSPLDPPLKVSKAQEAAYNNALDIANNPAIVMEKVKNGTLTIQDIKHLSSLYPALYPRMQQKLMDQLIAYKTKGQAIPYKTKLGLSMFMGQPLDSSMQPQAIQANQPQAAQAPQNQPPQPRHSTAKLSKAPLNSQTTSQAIDSRRARR